MKKTSEEALQIFKELGIEVKEVEEGVFGVMDKHKEVNIEQLGSMLEDCILLISSGMNYKKDANGYSIRYGEVYYAVLCTEKDDTVLKYYNISATEHKTTMKGFEIDHDFKEGIPSLFSTAGLGMLD